MRTAVAILAGGEGARMGGAKPLRRLGGTSLLGRALATARAWGDGPLAVALRDAGQAGDEPLAGAEVVLDVAGIAGPLAGLAAALDWAAARGCGAVLTLPCDMPFLPPDLKPRLEAGLTPDAGAAVAATGGRLHPVCALWRVETRALLARRAAEGRLSLNGLARAAGCAVVAWPDGGDDPFANLNTPEDLARAEAQSARTARARAS